MATDTYYMFKELAQKRSVLESISGSPIEYGVRIVVGAVLRDLVIGLASMFDSDLRATNLKRVLNTLPLPMHVEIFRSWHAGLSVSYNTDNGIVRLKRFQKRLNAKKVSDAIERIIDLRRKAIAHIDLEPEFKKGRLQVWEIEYALVAAASTVLAANLFATGRCIDVKQIRSNSRKKVGQFSNALLAGSKAQEDV